MFTVYLIKSKKGRLYTGYTSDLTKRLIEHNNGLCKSTKTDSDWEVVFTKRFLTRSEAMRYEKWLKTGVGREFVKNHILQK